MTAEQIAATRDAYDALAASYARLVGTELAAATEGPIERALLATFLGLVEGSTRPVADVGCGPGRVAAFLAANGIPAVGYDVSREMVAAARAAHPHIQFEEGELAALPVPNQSVGGAVCWYSIIHTPRERLGAVFSELARVLTPCGPVLLAFQAGNGEAVHRTVAYEMPVELTTYSHSPAEVGEGLAAAGFQILSETVREAELEHESAPQAFVLARAGGDDSPGSE